MRGHAGRGDVASIYEVISRRFRRYVEERAETGEVDGAATDDAEVPAGIDPETGRPRRFAYPPNLVVVDGGAPQVAAAQRALDELGVDDVALCGLAKRLEEVWLPGDPHPVVLPRTSEGLYLLQRVRDEAHRFAITHHRAPPVPVDDRERARRRPRTGRRPVARRCSSTSARSSGCAPPPSTRSSRCPGIGRRTAEAVVAALAAQAAHRTRP